MLADKLHGNAPWRETAQSLARNAAISTACDVTFVMPGQKREARLRARCAGHPRLASSCARKAWMAGSKPGHDESTSHIHRSESASKCSASRVGKGASSRPGHRDSSPNRTVGTLRFSHPTRFRDTFLVLPPG